jgi:hypothetical protein
MLAVRYMNFSAVKIVLKSILRIQKSKVNGTHRLVFILQAGHPEGRPHAQQRNRDFQKTLRSPKVQEDTGLMACSIREQDRQRLHR